MNFTVNLIHFVLIILQIQKAASKCSLHLSSLMCCVMCWERFSGNFRVSWLVIKGQIWSILILRSVKCNSVHYEYLSVAQQGFLIHSPKRNCAFKAITITY